MKKILIFIALNLAIGNTIAWFMGAAPIDFDTVQFSKQEQQLVEQLSDSLKNEADVSAQTQLGSLYSLHNQLDLANQWLEKAQQSDGEDPLVSAWLSANRAKMAGAMFDPMMGLVKTYRLHQACDNLNQAVAAEPESFEIRMIRLATFAPTNFINCSLEQAFEDEKWFKSFFAGSGKNAPNELKMQFSLTMTKAYANADNIQQAQAYMAEFKQLSENINLTPLLEHELNQANLLLTEGS